MSSKSLKARRRGEMTLEEKATTILEAMGEYTQVN